MNFIDKIMKINVYLSGIITVIFAITWVFMISINHCSNISENNLPGLSYPDGTFRLNEKIRMRDIQGTVIETVSDEYNRKDTTDIY